MYEVKFKVLVVGAGGDNCSKKRGRLQKDCSRKVQTHTGEERGETILERLRLPEKDRG